MKKIKVSIYLEMPVYHYLTSRANELKWFTKSGTPNISAVCNHHVYQHMDRLEFFRLLAREKAKDLNFLKSLIQEEESARAETARLNEIQKIKTAEYGMSLTR